MIHRRPKALLRAHFLSFVLAAALPPGPFPHAKAAWDGEPGASTFPVHLREAGRSPDAPLSRESGPGDAGSRGDEYHGPRNVLHADLLAWAVGKRLYGTYYERTSTRATKSLILGVGIARDQEFDTVGQVEADKLDVDMVGVGVQWRYYGSSAFGLYGLGGLSFSGGRAEGRDDPDLEYDCYGMEITLLGLGYQYLIGGHLALDASLSFRQQVVYLKPVGGSDDGFLGGFGFPLAGSIGFAF